MGGKRLTDGEARELWRKARGGDRGASDALVLAFLPLAYTEAKLHRRAFGGDLDDLRQEAVCRLVETVKDADPEHPVGFGPCARSAIRFRLLAMRVIEMDPDRPEEVPLDEAGELVAPEPGGGAVEAVDALLDRLNPAERKVVRIRFGLGDTEPSKRGEEVAARLGVSHHRARCLLARAMQKLRQAAKELGIEDGEADERTADAA